MTATRDVASLVAALDARAPFAKAADWDPVGLVLGDPGSPVQRVGLCHEVTEGVLDDLAERPVDLLIAYHPLLFDPVQRLLAGATPAGRTLRLAAAGTALVVLHTNLDAAVGGTSDALAEALGLDGLEPFGPVDPAPAQKLVTFVPAGAADALLDALAAAGAGRIGNYSHCAFRSEGLGSFRPGPGASPVVGEAGRLNLEPEVRLEVPLAAGLEQAVLAALVAAHPYEEPAWDLFQRAPEAGLVGRLGSPEAGSTLDALAERVRDRLEPPSLRVAPAGPAEEDAPVRRVAVVPGAGGDLWPAALAAGAEVLVTGDVSHHRARAAVDAGLSLIDPGHVATERPGLEGFLAFLATLGVETLSFLGDDPDPWRAAP